MVVLKLHHCIKTDVPNRPINPALQTSIDNYTADIMRRNLGPAVIQLWDNIRSTIASDNLQAKIIIEQLQRELETSRSNEKAANDKYRNAMKKSEECLQAAKRYKDELVKANTNLEKARQSYEILAKYVVALTQQLNARIQREQVISAQMSNPGPSQVHDLQGRVQELEKKLEKVCNTIDVSDLLLIRPDLIFYITV